MDESKQLCPCPECINHCKSVFAILLIVLGVSMLKDVIRQKNEQK